MKKWRFAFLCLLAIIVSFTAWKYFTSTYFIQSWMLYEYIEYDDEIYSRVIINEYFPDGYDYGAEELYPIYIFDTPEDKRLSDDRFGFGKEIVGNSRERNPEESEKITYLFFDSAEWKLVSSSEE